MRRTLREAFRPRTLRRRLLLAQLTPLLISLPLGAAAVVVLVRMTVLVQDVRTRGMDRLGALGEAIELFREEAVLIGQFHATGEAARAEAARARSLAIADRLDLGSSVWAQVPKEEEPADDKIRVLLDDYEQLAGLSGPPGDPAEADRAARHVLRAMKQRRDDQRALVDRQLASVARSGQVTAAVAVGVVGLLWLAGTVLSLRQSRGLVADLRALENGTSALAAGDFEHRIALGPDRPDELGRLSAAFNRMAARIGALDRMKVDFFANISHDLKTPLAALLESVDLMSDGTAGPLTQDQRRLVDIMTESVRRLRALVSNVLDVGRLGARNVELAPGDVGAAVDSVLSELRVLADRAGVTLARTGAERTPAALINRGMLEQALMNVVGNAIKFSPRGGRVVVDLSDAGPGALSAPAPGAVRVAVTDQGPGIPEPHREAVFERFFQVPGEGERRGGTGLGLYIARHIVEGHGGRIAAEEAAGGGARVWFTLAVAEEATATRDAGASLLPADRRG